MTATLLTDIKEYEEEREKYNDWKRSIEILFRPIQIPALTSAMHKFFSRTDKTYELGDEICNKSRLFVRENSTYGKDKKLLKKLFREIRALRDQYDERTVLFRAERDALISCIARHQVDG